MSSWKNWVESQSRTVEADGVCAAVIRLEAPDGAVWGTWSVKTPELEDVIEAAIELMAEDLSKERHSCRLVSYDGKGEQLAIMPHSVTGRSTEAAKQGNRDRAHAQATSVHLANAEQVLGVQSRQLQRIVEDHTNLFEDNLLLREKLVNLLSDTLANRASERLAEERLNVFKELVATSKPLLEAVIAMGAEFATFKFSEIVEGLKRKQMAEESATNENERLKKELEELRSAMAATREKENEGGKENREPVDGVIPDGAQRTRKTRGDGKAGSQGNRRRHAGNSGQPPARAASRRP